MKKLLIAALITCALAAMTISMTGCKKSVETAATPYYQLPRDVAERMVLPVGSYFIYKDSTTGVEDSIMVKESGVQKIFVPAHLSAGIMIPDSNADSLTLRFSNETVNGSSDWLLITHLQENATVSFYNDRTNGTTHDPVFWDPITNFFANDDRNGGFILPSMEVEGVNYSDVYRFLTTVGTPSTPGYRRIDCYWVKEIGLIKRVVEDDTEVHTWTLIKKG